MNSSTVLMVGWNVTCWLFGSFMLMPFTMKLTVSSRPPAELNENVPWPRRAPLDCHSPAPSPFPSVNWDKIHEMAAVQRNLLHRASLTTES